MNAATSPRTPPVRGSRWEQVLHPSYRVIEAESKDTIAQERVPAWVKRLGLNAKDLTVHHDR